MTRISERKTILRGETSAVWRGKPLMVLVTPHDVIVRQKGQRVCYAVPWLAVMELGAKMAAEEQRRLKLSRKQGLR
jgi:hypothetical protein